MSFHTPRVVCEGHAESIRPKRARESVSVAQLAAEIKELKGVVVELKSALTAMKPRQSSSDSDSSSSGSGAAAKKANLRAAARMAQPTQRGKKKTK